MNLKKIFTRCTLIVFVLALSFQLFAVDATYYTNLDGKSATTLFAALKTVSGTGATQLSYTPGIWNAYSTTDLYPADSIGKAGKIWDMYSNCGFTNSTDQCGTYTVECGCYNREHSLPKSWFGDDGPTTPPGLDLMHLVPTDGYVNNRRSNYAFGEVTSPSYTSGNGSKLGPNDEAKVAGYTGTVFEPLDEYKGDFARIYMYMVVRWADNGYPLTVTSDGQTTFNNTFTSAGNYGLTTYGLNLLMKWHRQDPVSQKEINRNNGVQTEQGNRNPFVDYPCLAEYLWGTSKDAAITLSSLCGSFETGFVAGSSTGCTSCSSGVAPTVTTPTYSEGSAGGNITSLGDPATLTENGIYYSTTTGFANGAGTKLAASTTATAIGTFSVDVTTLPEGTYYFKAFATNSTGTGYSAQETFTITGAAQAPATPLVLIGTAVTNTLTCTGTKTLNLHISNLANSVSVTSSNTGIVTVSPATITPEEAAVGVTLTVTKVTNGTANITISGGVVNQTISITCQ